MKRCAHEITIEKLEKDGWKIDHDALYNGYCFAGTVTAMKTKKGVEYCRVHTGKRIVTRDYPYNHSYQKTIVMCRG